MCRHKDPLWEILDFKRVSAQLVALELQLVVPFKENKRQRVGELLA